MYIYSEENYSHQFIFDFRVCLLCAYS